MGLGGRHVAFSSVDRSARQFSIGDKKTPRLCPHRGFSNTVKLDKIQLFLLQNYPIW